MPTEQLENFEEKVDVEDRVDQIEEILPTLSTKEDLKATKERLRAELADTEEHLRTHFDVVAECLRDLIRIVAEGVSTVLKRHRRDSQE